MDIKDDERDIKLQQTSAELIKDLNTSLHPFLWEICESRKTYLRVGVIERELSRLLSLIDNFQELPQLLDPHLENFITLLANSLLTYLQSPQISFPKRNQLLVPTSTAICKLLYRFCKVRGEKVIIRILSTEVRHIELLLDTLENRVLRQNNVSRSNDKNLKSEGDSICCWEEIYLLLLWLSQLIMTPFDLASISSEPCLIISEIKGLLLPPDSPKVALRIIPLAINCLVLPSKESDAAKTLLARLSLRKDMQSNGTTSILIRRSILQLRPNSEAVIHDFLGNLSFLASVLTMSIGTKDMEPFMFSIFETIQEIMNPEDSQLKALNSNVMARKMIIKILRSLAILGSQHSEDRCSIQLIESIIGYMIEAIADSSTIIRLAASKALSMITLKLSDEMADEVILSILSESDEFLVWEEVSRYRRRNLIETDSMRCAQNPSDEILLERSENDTINTLWTRVETVCNLDISCVNPLKWHGIMMTLSHLIYRRSIHFRNLSSAVSTLRHGLLFEQRSMSCASVGSFVRDAACFGIWSLARKYTTLELENLVIENKQLNTYLDKDSKSTIQILALDLVVSATLDPAGNIRRGASAALQELTGRHPNVIEKSIELVQTVDYHAIALRIRAIESVALEVSTFSDQYLLAILENLFGWQGIKNSDKSVRRVAAVSIGQLVWTKQSQFDQLDAESFIFKMIDRIVPEILLLKPRQADERHGLILALNSIIKNFLIRIDKQTLNNEIDLVLCSSKNSIIPGLPETKSQNSSYKVSFEESAFLFLVRSFLQDIKLVIKQTNKNFISYRAPKVLVEAYSQILISAAHLLKIDFIFQELERKRSMPQTRPVSTGLNRQKTYYLQKNSLNLLETLDVHYSVSTNQSFLSVQQYYAILEAYRITNGPSQTFMKLVKDLLDQLLSISDEYTVTELSEAMADYCLLCGPDHSWFLEFKNGAFTKNSIDRIDPFRAYIHTIFRFPKALYQILNNDHETFASAVCTRWNKTKSLEMRVTLMRCISNCSEIREYLHDFINLIKAGLDNYTMTYQGDVGSLLRIESIKAVKSIFEQIFAEDCNFTENETAIVLEELVTRLLRLASEKLDRIRIEVKEVLVYISSSTRDSLRIFHKLTPFSISSKSFFYCLLEIQCVLFPPSRNHHLFSQFIGGYITSLDGGSETVICASRAALVDFCQKPQIDCDTNLSSTNNGSFILSALLSNISSGNQRLVISALEILAFLISFGNLNQESQDQSVKIFDTVDKVLANSKNTKKIDAGIKLFGAFFMLEGPPDILVEIRQRAILSLIQKLAHPYPKVRIKTVDELFFRTGYGKGVDWINGTSQDIEELRKLLVDPSFLENIT